MVVILHVTSQPWDCDCLDSSLMPTAATGMVTVVVSPPLQGLGAMKGWWWVIFLEGPVGGGLGWYILLINLLWYIQHLDVRA